MGLDCGKEMKMKKVISLLLIACQISSISAQTSKDSLANQLNDLIANSRIPGLGVCIASEKGVLFSAGFGFRDLMLKEAYDSQTIQPIASVSKTIIGLALMKLVEEGKVNLEADINTILPFRIVNPHHPKSKITLLQLATHTSSIRDTYRAENASYLMLEKKASLKNLPRTFVKDYKRYVKSSPQNNEQLLQNYVSIDGKNFRKDIFSKDKPGESYAYSNLGASLAALAVEILARESFEAFTRKHIFQVLGMKNTSWKKADLPSTNLSKHYFQNGEEVPAYRMINYPAGMLHSNCEDMGKLMTEILRGCAGRGTLLSKESYAYMLTNRLATKYKDKAQGIFWDVNQAGSYFGHTGSNYGVHGRLVFNPTLKKAIYIMSNVSSFEDKDDLLAEDRINILNTLSIFVQKID